MRHGACTCGLPRCERQDRIPPRRGCADEDSSCGRSIPTAASPGLVRAGLLDRVVTGRERGSLSSATARSRWDTVKADGRLRRPRKLREHRLRPGVVTRRHSNRLRQDAPPSSRRDLGNERRWDESGSATEDDGVTTAGWSTDGTRIAFTTGGRQPRGLRDGCGRRQRDEPHQRPCERHDPNWSPDGSRIAFASNRDGNVEIYTMGTTGGGAVRLNHDIASIGSRLVAGRNHDRLPARRRHLDHDRCGAAPAGITSPASTVTPPRLAAIPVHGYARRREPACPPLACSGL